MIKTLILNNFRGHKQKTFEFGPGGNVLRGPNESGKSTVREALAFLFYGTDSAGTKNPDHLISAGEDATEVVGVTERSVFKRRKRRTATSDIKYGQLGLPDIKMSQTDFSNLLGMSVEAHFSCWQVGFFMNMPATKQMAVLAELAKTDRKEILASILPEGFLVPPIIKLVNPKVDADVVAGKRRGAQNSIASDKGALSQVEAQLIGMGQTTGEPDAESFQLRLNDLNCLVEAFDLYKRNADGYNAAKVAADTQATGRASLEAELAAQATTANEENVAAAMANGKAFADKIAVLTHEIEAVSATKRADPAAPKKPNVITTPNCPTCTQPINQEQVKSIMAAYESELMEFNKVAREVADFNGIVSAKVLELKAKIDAETLGKGEAARQYTENKTAIKIKTERAAELQKILAKPQVIVPQAPVKPEGDEEGIRKEVANLNAEIRAYNLISKQKQNLLIEKDRLVASINALESGVRMLSILEEGLKQLPEVEANRTIETIAVPGCDIKLREGEIILTNLEGIPYQSLSDGKKMKVNIGICGKLQAAAAPKAPPWIFVDNADLVDNMAQVMPQGQVFLAQVDPNVEELCVDVL